MRNIQYMAHMHLGLLGSNNPNQIKSQWYLQVFANGIPPPPEMWDFVIPEIGRLANSPSIQNGPFRTSAK